MEDTKNKREDLFGQIFAIGFVIVILAALVFGMYKVGILIFDFAGEAVAAAEVISDHDKVVDAVTAGTIIDKEIVNGHIINNGGLVTNPSTGSTGIIIGGNKTYVPTEYRLYIRAECVIDGETIEVEKYFDIPADTYNDYDIGDFFDSQSF